MEYNNSIISTNSFEVAEKLHGEQPEALAHSANHNGWQWVSGTSTLKSMGRDHWSIGGGHEGLSPKYNHWVHIYIENFGCTSYETNKSKWVWTTSRLSSFRANFWANAPSVW
jgi:hypothetical protein